MQPAWVNPASRHLEARPRARLNLMESVMYCYRDMTFCVQWELCSKGGSCGYALTEQVRKDAEKFGLPISQTDRRECFKPYSKSIERRLKVQEKGGAL